MRNDTATVLPDVSPGELASSLDQLYAGHIEFVGLNATDGWIQTAEAPGGYVVERKLEAEGVSPSPTRWPPSRSAPHSRPSWVATSTPA